MNLSQRAKEEHSITSYLTDLSSITQKLDEGNMKILFTIAIRKQISKFAKSLRIQMPIAWVSFHKVLQKSVDNNQSLHMRKSFPSLNSVGFQNQWFQAYCISTMRWESSFTTKASSHYTPRSLSIHSGLLSSYASFSCLNVTSYPDLMALPINGSS